MAFKLNTLNVGTGMVTTSRSHRLFYMMVVLLGVWMVSESFIAIEDAGERTLAIPEIDRAFVELKGNRTYRQGHLKPFTGWLMEHYEDGSIKSRSAMRNGLLHGVSEGWFRDGTLQVREHFLSGVSHGRRLKWYANGNRESEAMIVDGRLHGVFRRWHDNGILAEEIHLVSDQPEGLSKSWYPSGCLKAEVIMSHGKIESQKTWADGEMPTIPGGVESPQALEGL